MRQPFCAAYTEPFISAVLQGNMGMPFYFFGGKRVLPALVAAGAFPLRYALCMRAYYTPYSLHICIMFNVTVVYSCLSNFSQTTNATK